MNNNEQALKYLTDKSYEMTVINDQGLNRHLRFKHDNSNNGYFDIITWKGHLCFTGDMGSFLFSRINDMIEFFEGDNGVSPQYWHEKVLSESCFGGGVKEFDGDAFVKSVMEAKESFFDGDEIIDEDDAEAFDAVKRVGDEYDAVDFYRSFDIDGYELEGECLTFEAFTFHYLFACHAINFACNFYKKAK